MVENHSAMSEKNYRRQVKQTLIAHLSRMAYSPVDAKDYIEKYIYEHGRSMGLSIESCLVLSGEIYNSLYGLDVLQTFIDDDEVNEIMVNGCDPIIIEKAGRVMVTDQAFECQEDLKNIIQAIVSKVNRKADQSHPIVDARLEDGSRVNIVLAPIALNGPILTIRKFNNHVHSLSSLLSNEPEREVLLSSLSSWVRCKYNIFVSGSTSSGKTTFLNALSACIPAQERLITIEDSAELNLKHGHNVVTLETKPPQGEHAGVDMDSLIRTSLRMRPDRIIVGEVRGREAIEMVNAMNTGHDGSMSTGHANSCLDMLRRLELMILKGMDLPIGVMVRMLSSSLDIMIHLDRLCDGRRVIREIVEVMDSQDNYKLNPLYVRNNLGLEKINDLKNCRKLEMNEVL